MRRSARLAAGCLLAAAPIEAQQASLGSRIASVRDGMIQMHFAARPGVCGDGHGGVSIQGRHSVWFNDGRYACIGGPIVVRLGRSDGQTISVRKTIGGRIGSSSPDVDLGEVVPTDAARYLITLAHSIGGNSADEAVSAAALADGVDLSNELRALVRDDNASLEARRDALFWFGQSDAPTKELAALDSDLRPSSLREQYTFVLSQRRGDDEAIDKLIEVARTDRDFQIRKQAMFWLGQSKEPKAVKFLRDLIVK
jgi:hypothetical protein